MADALESLAVREYPSGLIGTDGIGPDNLAREDGQMGKPRRAAGTKVRLRSDCSVFVRRTLVSIAEHFWPHPIEGPAEGTVS